MTIQDCLTATEDQLFEHARSLQGTQVERKGHYIYIDNRHPLCLVAHVDTVRIKSISLEEKNGIIRNKHKAALGADDRAGVFALFQLAHLGCNLLFTAGEEVGGIGAQYAANDLDFNGVNLFIELDRKGANEYVFYSSSLPKQVKKYVESFGYREDWGSYSDIAEFEKIPGVNLSIGYYSQHTANEHLVLDEMQLNINRVQRMIENPIDKLYKPANQYKKSKRYSVMNDPWEADYKGWKNQNEPCDMCDKSTPVNDLIPYGVQYQICHECATYMCEVDKGGAL